MVTLWGGESLEEMEKERIPKVAAAETGFKLFLIHFFQSQRVKEVTVKMWWEMGEIGTRRAKLVTPTPPPNPPFHSPSNPSTYPITFQSNMMHWHDMSDVITH